MRIAAITFVGLSVAMAGCADGDLMALNVTGSLPSDERPSDEPLAMGRVHFEKANYGTAERHFRAATEANPHSIDAWLGLAASYDRLARFELAERAYGRVEKLGGKTPALLNNLGYHHMLRGNLEAARKYLDAAVQAEPGNPLIQGNIKLLATWKGVPAEPPRQ